MTPSSSLPMPNTLVALARGSGSSHCWPFQQVLSNHAIIKPSFKQETRKRNASPETNAPPKKKK